MRRGRTVPFGDTVEVDAVSHSTCDLPKNEGLAAIRAHNISEKFAGIHSDASRKDWIATADVDARLRAIIATRT